MNHKAWILVQIPAIIKASLSLKTEKAQQLDINPDNSTVLPYCLKYQFSHNGLLLEDYARKLLRLVYWKMLIHSQVLIIYVILMQIETIYNKLH